jgi:SAM-dependent methyltransferase
MDPRPTERFTSRVENYIRYRPGYPEETIQILEREAGLNPGWTIADIGSGPGNLSRIFLDHAYTVIGVEPNAAMREAGESLLSGYPNFNSVDGSAESTNLPEKSVEFITAGQAFHWFDPPAARREFQRILRKPGWVALIWNKRPEGVAPVLDAWHEMLLKYSPDYQLVRHEDDHTKEGMAILFGDAGYRKFTLPNEQLLDAEACWGRMISSSYTPLPGEPGHEEIKRRNQEIFEEYAVNGILRFPYETQIFLGQVRD